MINKNNVLFNPKGFVIFLYDCKKKNNNDNNNGQTKIKQCKKKKK